MDAGDLQGELRMMLRSLTAGDLSGLRDAINELPREDLDALLVVAVLRLASIEGVRICGGAMSDDELPRDPFVDDEHPYSGMLDRARMLRLAIEDAPDLEALYATLGALSHEECRWVVFELGFAALWERRHPGG